MEVIYRNWEPNQGLEELQAQIYNENNPAPQPTTAQQIVERFEREKIDPKTVRYAVDEEGKPLAYIQARDYENEKETHLGYPWALSDCPAEVQDKLFDEMLDYLAQREIAKEYDLRMNTDSRREEIVQFFKKKRLEVKSKSHRYRIDLNKVSKTDYTDEEYTTRIATPDDLDLLINLLKTDNRYSGQFGSDKELSDYFKDRVLKDGQEKGNNAVLVFDKDKSLVMASAPLLFNLPREEEESLILRFYSYLEKNERAYKPLIIKIAKECVSTGYCTDKPLIEFLGPRDTEQAGILEEYQPIKEVSGLSFGLKE